MFELRDKIRELDVATDMKFDLLGLYEMSELTDAEKKLMATIIHTAENEEKAAEEVFEILNAPNAVNMDEDCEPEREFKEVFHPAYEELQNGDEIIVNGQHLYVADAEYADDYVWVTDEKEDRYNKRAPGNTLAKYIIDDVIGQPDDDDDEELDESLKDFMFTVKCNDGPKELIKVVAEDKAKAEEYAKKMYAQNHTTYADDRHNIWSIEANSNFTVNEALYGMNEIKQFVKMASQLGLKTMGDFKDFMDREGQGKDVITALYDYLHDEIGDLNFQAKDESLKESDDSQFDKAVEAMKAYWNYQMSLEQLHNTLLKIYNNDAEKAFKVFVEYGDAARRSKDECLNCDPKEENVPTVKEEVLKEDNDAEEWEEVASKAVEDSDGFMTDYVWYTNGDKHVFIFGDSDIYRPEDGYFDWEVDIVEGKEAEAYKEAQDWFNSYNGFAEELDEAQDLYDIQGQAVRDARRKEVLDEFKEIFTDEPGGINLDNKETLAIVRGYLEDMGYVVEVSETQNASHPIHIEWFK